MRILPILLVMMLAFGCSPQAPSGLALDLVEKFPAARQGPVLSPSAPLASFQAAPYLGKGWAVFKHEGARPILEPESSLRYYSYEAASVLLRLAGRALDEPVSVEVSHNGEKLGSVDLTIQNQRFEFALRCRPGENVLRLSGASKTAWSLFEVGTSPQLTPRVRGQSLFLPFDQTLDFWLEGPGTLVLERAELWHQKGVPTDLDWEIEVTQEGQKQALYRRVEVTGGPVRLAARARDPLPGQLGVGLQGLRLLTDAEARSSTPVAETLPAGGPNVLLYVIDTLRADKLGCYGHQGGLTPRLDAFAQDSVVFEQALAQSPWTKPSVASIFTSLGCRTHGVHDFGDKLPGVVTTLAEILYQEGYSTAGFTANGLVSATFGYHQGFENYTLRFQRHSSQLNGEVEEWLDQRDQTRPFFLYFHSLDPHEPYNAPEPFRQRFAPGVPAHNPLGQYVSSLRQASQRGRQAALPDPGVEGLQRLYEAEVAGNDASFGDLIDSLKKRELYQNTIIVLVSDHGEEFLEHGSLGHLESLYDELLRVPLMIKLPDGLAGGRRVESVWQHIDIAPTILHWVGLSPHPDMEGVAFRPDLEETSPRPAFVYVRAGSDAVKLGQAREPWLYHAEGVRLGSEMLIRTYASLSGRAEPLEFYDLSSDPRQQRNLAFVAPDRSLRLEHLLNLKATYQGRTVPQASPREVERYTKSLQYLR